MSLRALAGGAALALLLGAACAAPAATRSGSAPAPGSGPLLYAPNQNSASVSVIDAGTGALVATVDLAALGFSANARPHHVVGEPDGSFWYASLIGDDVVVKFDRRNRVVGRAPTVTPGMLALDHRRGRLYASRSMTAVQAPSAIAVVRTDDMAVLEELEVLVPRPHAIAADTVSGRVYVAGLGDNRIATVDERGRVALHDVPGPNHVYVTFALSPDGRRLAASTQLTSKLLAFDAGAHGLRQIGAVDVLPWGYQIAYSPDGRSVWLGNQLSDAATEVDATTWQVAGVVRSQGFAEPHGVAVSPDGRTVFVSSHGRGAAAPTSRVSAEKARGGGTRTDSAHAGTHADSAMAGMHRDEGPREAGTVVLIDAGTRAVRSVVEVGRYTTGLGLGGR